MMRVSLRRARLQLAVADDARRDMTMLMMASTIMISTRVMMLLAAASRPRVPAVDAVSHGSAPHCTKSLICKIGDQNRQDDDATDPPMTRIISGSSNVVSRAIFMSTSTS